MHVDAPSRRLRGLSCDVSSHLGRRLTTFTELWVVVVASSEHRLRLADWGVCSEHQIVQQSGQYAAQQRTDPVHLQCHSTPWICVTLNHSHCLQCESKKNLPQVMWHFFTFFTTGWEYFIDFFTHPLYVPVNDRFQIFIQLSPMLTKLCHIKRDYLVHIMCSKCPPSAETHAFRRLRKSLFVLLIVVCGKSL